MSVKTHMAHIFQIVVMLIVVVALGCLIGTPDQYMAQAVAARNASAADCPALPDTGKPELKIGSNNLSVICHKAYAAVVDNSLRIPLWVAYTLTKPHTMGCDPRANDFHAEAAIPAQWQAKPSDYDKTGYDKGHQAPAEDFTWSEQAEQDSFSMANMAPQKPGLNREQWERLEETVRAWAWGTGSASIFVGPVVTDDDKTLGRDRIDIPAGFWKVITRPDRDAMAFIMDNKTIPKGDLAPFLTTVDAVEKRTGLILPKMKQSDQRPSLWPVDLNGWRSAHKTACR